MYHRNSEFQNTICPRQHTLNQDEVRNKADHTVPTKFKDLTK